MNRKRNRKGNRKDSKEKKRERSKVAWKKSRIDTGSRWLRCIHGENSSARALKEVVAND
jgi:hypothetical protein